MNILIITPRYPYKNNMEFVFVKKLVDEWVKSGHKCIVVTLFSYSGYFRKKRSYVPKHYVERCKTNEFIDVYNFRYFSIPRFRILGVDVSQLVECLCIDKNYRKLGFHPDFLYCHFFSSGVLGWYLNKKYKIPYFVASGESTIPKILSPSINFSTNIFRDMTSGCVCVSTKNLEEALLLGYANASKCKVFPNGVDLNLFKILDKKECRDKVGFSSNDFIVICVGYFCERKGQRRVLEAVKRISNPSIKVVFIGNDSDGSGLLLNGEEILFKGNVPNGQLPFYLCASDVFCLPTLKEGCCNAIIEAMACGLPIISSALSFNFDILDDTNSILINPNNIDEIANAIRKMLFDKEMRLKKGITSHNKASSLSIENRANNIMNFIKERI